MYCTLYIIHYHINPDPLTKLIHAFKRRFLGFIDPTMRVLLQSLQKCNFMTFKGLKKLYETMLQTKMKDVLRCAKRFYSFKSFNRF